MADYPTNVHGPASAAPETTGKYAVCQVCESQWQVRSFDDPPTDTNACAFCGAPRSRISVRSEDPEFGDANLVGFDE